MSVSFLAAGGAAAVAAVITGILVGRFANLPRLDQAAWMCAATGLTIALAAQALGYHQGFNAAAFRAIQVGARLVAPVALVWGLAELTGKSFGARFAARLALAALTAIAGAILVADPLSGVGVHHSVANGRRALPVHPAPGPAGAHPPPSRSPRSPHWSWWRCAPGASPPGGTCSRRWPPPPWRLC